MLVLDVLSATSSPTKRQIGHLRCLLIFMITARVALERVRRRVRAFRFKPKEAHDEKASVGPDLAEAYSRRWSAVQRQVRMGFAGFVLMWLSAWWVRITRGGRYPTSGGLEVAMTMDASDAGTLLAAVGAFVVAIHLRLASLGAEAMQAEPETPATIHFLASALEVSTILSTWIGLATITSGRTGIAEVLVLAASLMPAVLTTEVLGGTHVSSARTLTAASANAGYVRCLEITSERRSQPLGHRRSRRWVAVEILLAAALPAATGAAGWALWHPRPPGALSVVGTSVAMSAYAFLVVGFAGRSIANRDRTFLVVSALGLGLYLLLGLIVLEGVFDGSLVDPGQTIRMVWLLTLVTPLAFAWLSLRGRLRRSGALREFIALPLRASLERVRTDATTRTPRPEWVRRFHGSYRFWSGEDQRNHPGPGRAT